MSERWPRMNGRQIALLRFLARRGAIRPVAIARHFREIAVTLWRREVVEVWYQQVPGEGRRGPFFALTIAGWKLAGYFLDDRGRDVAPALKPARKRRREMLIKDYDPARPGQGFQGDIAIVPIPGDIAISTIDEILPLEGRLILQEGEATGHHHAVYLLNNIPKFRDDAMARDLFAAQNAGAAAHLYRDPTVAPEMVRRGILTRSDLAIACLVVENGPMILAHEEHDGVRFAPGRYLVGGQVESVGAEERRVLD